LLVNILVIEDDPTLARSLAAGLARAGHRAEVALGGESGLDRARSHDFEAVVTDWMLPGVDGTEIVREVRSRAGSQPLIILISGLDGPLVRAHAARVGADAFLTKPVTEAALTRALAAGPRNTQEGAAVAAWASTQTWHDLSASLASTLSESVGVGMTLGFRQHDDGAVRVAVSMVDVEKLLELELCVFASTETGECLARLMLREQNVDLSIMRDLLKEIGHGLLGGIKTAASSEGFDFTLSLEDRGEPPLTLETEGFSAGATYTFESRGVEISVRVGARRAPVEAVVGTWLREDMILLEDLHNDKGILILPRGTRLTASSAGRAARHVPNRTVRVCGTGKVA
jgi:CheY-like chemotaxis protein